MVVSQSFLTSTAGSVVDRLRLFSSGSVPQVVELNGTEGNRSCRLESWKGDALHSAIVMRRMIFRRETDILWAWKWCGGPEN